MTKREMYTEIANLLSTNEEIVAFCNHELELLDRKREKGSTKANEKSETEMALVYETLASVGGNATISQLIASGCLNDLANDMGVVSTQKVSSVLRKLVANGSVESYKDKKVTYFRIVENGDSE